MEDQDQKIKMEKLNVEADKETKIIAIVIEIILVIVFILVYLLYSSGNQYVVANTIDGLPILLASTAVGLSTGFILTFIIGKSSLSNIKFAKLQEFIGFWSLFAPIFLFGYIGFSLNLKLSNEKSENIETIIEDKSGDLIMQSYYLKTKLKEKIIKIRVSKTGWKSNNIGDTLKLSIINGFFGYDVVQYELDRNK